MKKYLNEDTLINNASAWAENSSDKELHTEDSLYEVLDRALATSRRQKKLQKRGFNAEAYQNILLVGPAGVGKTARFKEWAKKRGIRIESQDAKGMDPSDIGGAISPDRETGAVAVKLATTQFDKLDTGESEAVLFLDELNRAMAETRGSLLTLINNHEVPDPRVPGGSRVLRDLVFTVAAINPNTVDSAYNTGVLDPAELSRFYIVYVTASNKDQLEYYNRFYGDIIKNYEDIIASGEADKDDVVELQEYKGRLALATKILNSDEFFFDDDVAEAQAMEDSSNILNPRTLTACLEHSDGTKKSFLKFWEGHCSSRKYATMQNILREFRDIDKDDKANAVFKKPSQSVFKNEKSSWDEFSKYLDDNGIE